MGSGWVGYWKKYRVAGRVGVGFGSGRSVEIDDRVSFLLSFFGGSEPNIKVFSNIY